MVEGVAQLWLSPCGVRSVSNEGRAGAQKGRRRTEEDGGRQVYEREKGGRPLGKEAASVVTLQTEAEEAEGETSKLSH